MTDLTDWLAEQHAADERVARNALDGPWIPRRKVSPSGVVDPHGQDVAHCDESEAAHIARHDPQATLARIGAERMLVAMHRRDGYGDHEFCVACADTIDFGGMRDGEWPCPTLRALAWGYRGRDGYRADLWAPDGVEVRA